MTKLKIFIEVGSHKMPFDRLFTAFDELIKSKKLNANVFAQTGYTVYNGNSFDHKDFISEKELVDKIKWCDVVVSHAGAGNIITALSLNKPIVVVPRRASLGEHTDDHQTQLAKALDEEGKCVSVFDTKDILNAINKAIKMKSKPKAEKDFLIKNISDFIKQEKKGSA